MPWWIIEGNSPTTIELQRKSYSLAKSLLPERPAAVCLAGWGWLSEKIDSFLSYWFHWGKNHQTESHIFHVHTVWCLWRYANTCEATAAVKKSNVPSPPKGKQGFEEHKFHKRHQTHKEMSVLKLKRVSVPYFFDLCKPHLNLMRTFLFVTACPTSLPPTGNIFMKGLKALIHDTKERFKLSKLCNPIELIFYKPLVSLAWVRHEQVGWGERCREGSSLCECEWFEHLQPLTRGCFVVHLWVDKTQNEQSNHLDFLWFHSKLKFRGWFLFGIFFVCFWKRISWRPGFPWIHRDLPTSLPPLLLDRKVCDIIPS